MCAPGLMTPHLCSACTLAHARALLQGADPSVVNLRCKKRGLQQCGSLGAGNHYAEVQVVEEVFDDKAAKGALSLWPRVYGLGSRVLQALRGRRNWRMTRAVYASDGAHKGHSRHHDA